MTTHRHCCCDTEENSEYGILVKNTRETVPFLWTWSTIYGTLRATPPVGYGGWNINLRDAYLAEHPTFNLFFVKGKPIGVTAGLSANGKPINDIRGISADYVYRVKPLNGPTCSVEYVDINKLKIENYPPEVLGQAKDLYVNANEWKIGFASGSSPAQTKEPYTVKLGYNLILPERLKNQNLIVPEFNIGKNYYDQFCLDNNEDCSSDPNQIGGGLQPAVSDIYQNTPKNYYVPLNKLYALSGDNIDSYKNLGIISDFYTTFYHFSETRPILNNEMPIYQSNGTPRTRTIFFRPYSWNIHEHIRFGSNLRKSFVYGHDLPKPWIKPPEACCVSDACFPNGCCITPLHVSVLTDTLVQTKVDVQYSKGMNTLDSFIRKKQASKTSPLYIFKSIDRGYLSRMIDDSKYLEVAGLPHPLTDTGCFEQFPLDLPLIVNKISAICLLGTLDSCCIPGLKYKTYSVPIPEKYKPMLYVTSRYQGIRKGDTNKYYIVKFCKNTVYDPVTKTSSTILLLQDEYEFKLSDLSIPATDSPYDNSASSYDIFLGGKTPKIPIKDGFRFESITETENPSCCDPIQLPYTEAWQETSIQTNTNFDCDGNAYIIKTTIKKEVPSSGSGNYNRSYIYPQRCCGGQCSGNCPDAVGYDPSNTNQNCSRPDPNDPNYPFGARIPCGCSPGDIYTLEVRYEFFGKKYTDPSTGETVLLGQNFEIGCDCEPDGSCFCPQGVEGFYTTQYRIVDSAPACSCECPEQVADNSSDHDETIAYWNQTTYAQFDIFVPNDLYPYSSIQKSATGTGSDKIILNVPGVKSDKNFIISYIKAYFNDSRNNLYRDTIPGGTSNKKIYLYKATNCLELLPEDMQITQYHFGFKRYSPFYNQDYFTPYLNPLNTAGEIQNFIGFGDVANYERNIPGPVAKSNDKYGSTPKLTGAIIRNYASAVYECSNDSSKCVKYFYGIFEPYSSLAPKISTVPLGTFLPPGFTLMSENFSSICSRIVNHFGITNDSSGKTLAAIDIFSPNSILDIPQDYEISCFPKYVFKDTSTFKKLFWKNSSVVPDV
jgi:hypothetical protein